MAVTPKKRLANGTRTRTFKPEVASPLDLEILSIRRSPGGNGRSALPLRLGVTPLGARLNRVDFEIAAGAFKSTFQLIPARKSVVRTTLGLEIVVRVVITFGVFPRRRGVQKHPRAPLLAVHLDGSADVVPEVTARHALDVVLLVVEMQTENVDHC